MNPYKPLALFSTAALVAVLGYNVASARPAEANTVSNALRTTAGSGDEGVQGDYRRMHAAVEHLRIARDHLMNSEHNHGGFRERAVEATDRAIHETEVAIEWHP